MNEEIRSLLGRLENDDRFAAHIAVSEALDQLPQQPMESVRFAILSNITIDNALPFIRTGCYGMNLRPEIFIGDFDVVMQYALDPESSLYRFRPDFILLILHLDLLAPSLAGNIATLSTETVSAELERIRIFYLSVVDNIRLHSSARILLCGFHAARDHETRSDSERAAFTEVILRLNTSLRAVASSQSGAFFVDLEREIARIGFDRALDDRFAALYRQPYSIAFARLMAAEVLYHARIVKGRAKKALVLDCDNTLWGGIVGEDGSDKIILDPITETGRSFMEFQRIVLELHQKGVMLAICSRNNVEDVMDVFRSHPHMVLKPEHFVAMRIDWNSKSGHIEEIREIMRIATDQIVFVDDDARECEAVRQAHPELQVVLLPEERCKYPDVIRGLAPLFETGSVTAEDRARTTMIRSDSGRRSAESRFDRVDDYLASLQIRIRIDRLVEPDVARASQLSLRTNQFNVTTRRYTEEAIRQLMLSPDHEIYTLAVQDRFGNLGTTGLAILVRDARVLLIDTFLMSCRIIGRKIEFSFLRGVLERSILFPSANEINAQFIPSARNAVVGDLFDRAGFSRYKNEHDRVLYRCAVESLKIPAVDFIHEETIGSGI